MRLRSHRLTNPDYWITTFAIALFLTAFLVGLAIAQVLS